MRGIAAVGDRRRSAGGWLLSVTKKKEIRVR